MGRGGVGVEWGGGGGLNCMLKLLLVDKSILGGSDIYVEKTISPGSDSIICKLVWR